jgi:hypothetical protein
MITGLAALDYKKGISITVTVLVLSMLIFLPDLFSFLKTVFTTMPSQALLS